MEGWWITLYFNEEICWSELILLINVKKRQIKMFQCCKKYKRWNTFYRHCTHLHLHVWLLPSSVVDNREENQKLLLQRLSRLVTADTDTVWDKTVWKMRQDIERHWQSKDSMWEGTGMSGWVRGCGDRGKDRLKDRQHETEWYTHKARDSLMGGMWWIDETFHPSLVKLCQYLKLP